MRARELAFEGDVEMLVASRKAIREEFTKNKDVTDPTQLKELFLGVEEAVDMLKHQIVQGVRKGDGDYELNVAERHTSLDPNQAPGAK
jgi:hypothetical protein